MCVPTDTQHWQKQMYICIYIYIHTCIHKPRVDNNDIVTLSLLNMIFQNCGRTWIHRTGFRFQPRTCARRRTLILHAQPALHSTANERARGAASIQLYIGIGSFMPGRPKRRKTTAIVIAVKRKNVHLQYGVRVIRAVDSFAAVCRSYVFTCGRLLMRVCLLFVGCSIKHTLHTAHNTYTYTRRRRRTHNMHI